MNSGKAMIEIENLNVFYGILRVLKGINMKVFSREIVALVGPNGIRKTTLLRTINGLVRP